MQQTVYTVYGEYTAIDRWLDENKVERLFLVCDQAIRFLQIDRYFMELPTRKQVLVTRFSAFQPNPTYESVVEGVELLRGSCAQAIVAVGGGSAMDVAKCVKLYSNMSNSESYLKQTIVPNTVPLLAVPTTAGTGSEATRYAVIYSQGEKQSVTHESCIPQTVLLDSSVLQTLPLYQKKSTMLDAFCHAVESFWSVNSTDESKQHSRAALEGVLAHLDGYLANDDAANRGMLLAANEAGRAINITQTTAGHAMCYKLTSLYCIAHGHAAALCVRALWLWTLRNLGRCIDPRGPAYLAQTLQELAVAMGCESPDQAAAKFTSIYESLALPTPTPMPEDFDILAHSVNPVRLKNFPVLLDMETIDTLYREILS